MIACNNMWQLRRRETGRQNRGTEEYLKREQNENDEAPPESTLTGIRAPAELEKWISRICLERALTDYVPRRLRSSGLTFCEYNMCKEKFVLMDIPMNKSERRVNKTGKMYRTGVEWERSTKGRTTMAIVRQTSFRCVTERATTIQAEKELK